MADLKVDHLALELEKYLALTMVVRRDLEMGNHLASMTVYPMAPMKDHSMDD